MLFRSRRLALGQATKEEATKLAREGKTIVWIDSGLHATEVAPVQQAPHLAYRMLTDESPEFQRFRDKVILMQVPVINPDGLDVVAHWYRSNAGTPYARAGVTKLYQKYAGHDNNRDWCLMLVVDNLREPILKKQLRYMPRLFQIQHEPIAVIIVPGILLVKFGHPCPRIRRACVRPIPMCHHVQPIGVNHRHLHQNHFVAKALKLW